MFLFWGEVGIKTTNFMKVFEKERAEMLSLNTGHFKNVRIEMI